jgi:glutamate/tyrosine decarboxylase-like PLP-dependent enzyme
MRNTTTLRPEGERESTRKAELKQLLQGSCDMALAFLEGVHKRPVGRPVEFDELLNALRVPLREEGEDPLAVIQGMARALDPGLVATPGPRYFGFVVGGAQPVSVAADSLGAAWDQAAFSYVSSPAAAAVEEVSREWLLELFGLPSTMSAGFTTGCTMANFTGLAAARHALLKKLGWDVESRGLFSAPEITVIASEESHITLFGALQLLGLGRDRVIKIKTDEQGRMRADDLRNALASLAKPPIVCAQAGNVDTGSFDPLSEIAALTHERGGWLHVDGAFGLWVAASRRMRDLIRGVEEADSIAFDCHKWLNVPQDSGVVLVRDQAAHRAAMTWNAPYYVPGPENGRDNHNFVPESSRRARGLAVYATLRTLGRNGIATLIERCCGLAVRMAGRLGEHPQVQILNDVVLNQVLVRLSAPPGNDEAQFTKGVIQAVQADGTCWLGGTNWHGMPCIRIAISNWSTTDSDIDRSAEAILKCLEVETSRRRN